MLLSTDLKICGHCRSIIGYRPSMPQRPGSSRSLICESATGIYVSSLRAARRQIETVAVVEADDHHVRRSCVVGAVDEGGGADRRNAGRRIARVEIDEAERGSADVSDAGRLDLDVRIAGSEIARRGVEGDTDIEADHR